MEQQIIVKTEANGDILLYYVDENGGNEEGVITTVENIEGQAVQLQQAESYIVEGAPDSSEELDFTQLDESNWTDNWVDEETKRLLVFYNDNKDTFLNGPTKRVHLWTVACKTMLTNKSPNLCELKLRSLLKKYIQVRIDQQRGIGAKWPYFEACHRAFYDSQETQLALSANANQLEQPMHHITTTNKENVDGIIMVKKVNSNRTPGEEKVEMMLNLYLKYKNNQKLWQRGFWETITLEMGEEDSDFWHKRFLNYKQHYIRMLDKRKLSGPDSINWPYMKHFDKIFENDIEFQQKYGGNKVKEHLPELSQFDWEYMELMVLAKYCFDSFKEFQDPTIPNKFLWHEVGRLLDKTPESCKEKIEELKKEHLDKYIEGGYDLRNRVPLSILLDNIICKEVETQLIKSNKAPKQNDIWKTEEIDEVVQFFYENVEMFKEPICYYVCWAAIAKKLHRKINSCMKQWQDLTVLYKSILEDKKEDPDMQIDWRYIELFDRIFDYGMDTNLLNRPEKLGDGESDKVKVKKLSMSIDENSEGLSDEEEYDERGFTKRSKGRPGESKAFKILEFYQKNKDKFATSQRKKQVLWEILAKQIGISAEQCAHRFRNLKQVYTAYVQREIMKPEMPILWPYYALCKKVFGVRAIKSQLKNGKLDNEDVDEWAPKEIKLIIKYFGQHFDEINSNTNDADLWMNLTRDIPRTATACRDKFLELRKSYRKLKTMKARNPEVKVIWKYFAMIDDIYQAKGENVEIIEEVMEVDDKDYINDDGTMAEEYLKNGFPEDITDDDYQCIIVIPEGQDISDINPDQIIIQEVTEPEVAEPKPTLNKWTKRTKKRLLIFYLNYIRSHRGKEIKPKEMWTEIAAKLGDKTPLSCRKMFAKLKRNHLEISKDDVNLKKTPYYTLLDKIIAMKPKFVKTGQTQALQEGKVYKDVPLPYEKVEAALQYYLQNIEEFVDPKYEKKYLWTELANTISEPVTKIFHKINYLKQAYNFETDDIGGEKSPFSVYIKDIIAKESVLKDLIDPGMPSVTESEEIDLPWSEDEVEQLLQWYLANLEKFKNPKFVRSYLWMEASVMLKKSPLACSKKMSEIRTQYRTMFREMPEQLSSWRFYELCQKIYGTGKRSALSTN